MILARLFGALRQITYTVFFQTYNKNTRKDEQKLSWNVMRVYMKNI